MSRYPHATQQEYEAEDERLKGVLVQLQQWLKDREVGLYAVSDEWGDASDLILGSKRNMRVEVDFTQED